MPHYLIEGTHANAGPDRLVKAATKAQAVAHVAKQDYTVKVASVDDVVEAMKDGVAVETVGEEAAVAE